MKESDLKLPTQPDELKTMSDYVFQDFFAAVVSFNAGQLARLEQKKERGRPNSMGEFLDDAVLSFSVQGFSEWLKQLYAEAQHREDHPLVNPITGERYDPRNN